MSQKNTFVFERTAHLCSMTGQVVEAEVKMQKCKWTGSMMHRMSTWKCKWNTRHHVRHGDYTACCYQTAALFSSCKLNIGIKELVVHFLVSVLFFFTLMSLLLKRSNILHFGICSVSQWGWTPVTVWMSYWTAIMIFFLHFLVTWQQTIKVLPLLSSDAWLTFCFEPAHFDLQFLLSPLMKYRHLLSATISAPLLSACQCACFYTAYFLSAPCSTQEEHCRCKMTQWSLSGYRCFKRNSRPNSVFTDFFFLHSVRLWAISEV